MRFYTGKHAHYCGIDLHTRKMYLCIVDRDGEVLFHRNIDAKPEPFLEAVAPYRDDLVVCTECMHCWYWIADLCADEGIPFVLGHALYMKAIHGAKKKNDKVDSERIAHLLRSGMIPQSYVYPRALRSTRDLLRRRARFVSARSQLLHHIQTTNAQCNLEPFEKRITYASNRVEQLSDRFEDPVIQTSIDCDCELLELYDLEIRRLEGFLEKRVKAHDPRAYYLLRSIPGIGKILAMTIIYEIHDIDRFETVGSFASYSRLVKCPHSSNDKLHGYGDAKIGNVYLKWAFSEAAVLSLRGNPRAKQLQARLQKKYGKQKALTVLAHKTGRAVYFMLKRHRPFDADRFYTNQIAA